MNASRAQVISEIPCVGHNSGAASFSGAIAKLLIEDQIGSTAESGNRIKSEIAGKRAEIVKARQSASGAAA
jgi:hypothetical protein